ncbi:unnamed protein product, partial [Laminaria digitata]
VPHPLLSLQGQPLLCYQRDVDLCSVMGQLKDLPLSLGVAPVWRGSGVPRSAEEFAVACGFSAAFGPLLFEHAVNKVFGKKEAFSSGVGGDFPAEKVDRVCEKFWGDEIAPFDAAERFFRLVGNSDHRGGIGQEDLRPYLMAIAEKHPDLATMAPANLTVYVDTVLAVLYYKYSRRGVISLRDLRTSGFVKALNAIGRLETGLEVRLP